MRTLSEIIFNQHPVVLRADATVKAACQKMRDRKVGSVLIVDGAGGLAGIFTGRDAVWRVLAAGKSARTTSLGEVMTANPRTMSPDLKAIDALRLMENGGFRHMPVVADGKLLGVVSRGDFKGAEQDRLDEERSLWEHMR